MHWDSSFLCQDAPSSGSYQFTFTVTNLSGVNQPVVIESIPLRRATPRSHPRAASGTINGTSRFQTTIDPLQSASFTVTGNYQQAITSEGEKAKLHFQVRGRDVMFRRFQLGVNAHLRGPRSPTDHLRRDGAGPEGPVTSMMSRALPRGGCSPDSVP
ncbi:MAG: hypothetical protein WD793_12860 [Steroidobacteraceae bacterium]